MTSEIIRKKKSVKIEPKLLNRLSKWYGKQKSKTDAQMEIGVCYRVLDNAILRGTCSPDTKTRIQNFFN